MCFSAEASFAMGAALLPAGLYCTGVAVRKLPRAIPLALIPCLFGVQQFSEGVVWVALAREDASLVRSGSLVFLGFALGLWPFWAPFSVLCLHWRKPTWPYLAVASLLGGLFGGALYLPLLMNPDDWLSVARVHHSLRYTPAGLPVFSFLSHTWWDIGYGLLVLVPLLLASANRHFGLFFLGLLASAVVSLIAFHEAFVSVWCFFAALLSAQLCFHFAKLHRP